MRFIKKTGYYLERMHVPGAYESTVGIISQGSPLYSMENIFLTPHLAGSMDGECARMGSYMVEELIRYIRNEKFKWNITEEMVKTIA